MFRDMAPRPDAGTVTRARKLRRTKSLPEVLVWRELRKRPSGLKFRKQHPTGPYDLDFYCSDARLAIEIDGAAHSRGDRPARDEARDRWLAEYGIATMRVPAIDVLRDLASVVAGILVCASTRLPVHHPASQGGPHPRDKLGED